MANKEKSLEEKFLGKGMRETRRLVKNLIDAGEALPEWFAESYGPVKEDIYEAGGLRGFKKGWAKEFMSEKEIKNYENSLKAPVKKSGGGMAKKTSTRSKPRGVGGATHGYGRVMR